MGRCEAQARHDALPKCVWREPGARCFSRVRGVARHGNILAPCSLLPSLLIFSCDVCLVSYAPCAGVTYLSHPHFCVFRVSRQRCAPYANGRAAAGVLSCHGVLPLPSSVGLVLLRWCGMLPTYVSYVFSPLLFLTVLCLLRRILACVVWRRFISYLHSTRLHTPLWTPLFVVLPARAA